MVFCVMVVSCIFKDFWEFLVARLISMCNWRVTWNSISIDTVLTTSSLFSLELS